MFVTFRNAFLVIAGKDYQGRDLILTYNFPDMVKYSKVDLVTRQLSDFTIFSIKNNPINDTMFVSGGKENIRFWRIKGVISGTSIVLNKIGRGKHFTNILFDYEFHGGDDEDLMPSAKANGKKSMGKIHWVYVSTTCGHIFQINYHSREIEQVLKIHDDCITALEMTADRKITISSSLDGLIRLFSQNFTQCITELKTNVPIINLDLNIYSNRLASISTTG